MTPPRSIIFWIGYVLAWTVAITTAGALAGAVAFPLVGTWLGLDDGVRALAWSGARQIGFLAFIWGPGAGIVLAFDRAYRARRARENQSPEAR